MKMKKIKQLSSYLCLLFAFMIVVGCSSDDPEPVNQEELITTVTVTFTGTGSTTGSVVATFTDLDGPGGNSPVITNPVTLQANGTYAVTVAFLNEAESPAENITEEVSEESDEHQVFFVASSGLSLNYQYADTDSNNLPLGLLGTVTTGAASTGTLQVLLIHEPVKTATGVSAGNPTNAGGETDISVSFNMAIQ
jgi:hypothetical protein